MVGRHSVKLLVEFKPTSLPLSETTKGNEVDCFAFARNDCNLSVPRQVIARSGSDEAIHYQTKVAAFFQKPPPY